MNNKTILILSILTIICFNLYSQNLFEGKIYYKVETELKYENNRYNNYLSNKWGDTLVVYHSKDGFQKREYKNSKPYGFEYQIYNPKKNIYYGKWNSNDTVYYYECSETVTELTEIRKSEDKMGFSGNWNSVTMKFYYTQNDEYVEAKYFFDRRIKMNPINYERFKDFHFNILYKEIKSHIMQWSLDMDLVKVTFEAVKVEEMKLSKKIFNLDENLPYKKS